VRHNQQPQSLLLLQLPQHRYQAQQEELSRCTVNAVAQATLDLPNVRRGPHALIPALTTRNVSLPDSYKSEGKQGFVSSQRSVVAHGVSYKVVWKKIEFISTDAFDCLIHKIYEAHASPPMTNLSTRFLTAEASARPLLFFMTYPTILFSTFLLPARRAATSLGRSAIADWHRVCSS